jgi:hypothetical protein
MLSGSVHSPADLSNGVSGCSIVMPSMALHILSLLLILAAMTTLACVLLAMYGYVLCSII